MRYTPISESLFIKNRNKIIAQLPKNSIAIIHSNDQMPRNGDLFYPYRQNSDFFYATGIEQEKSILMLCPDEVDPLKQAALFIIKPKPELETWEGKKLTIEEAHGISGISNIHFEESFSAVLARYLKKCKYVYLNKNENPRFESNVQSRDERFTQIIKKKFPEVIVERLAPIISDCRMRKEPEEIELIKTACAITKNAFDAVRSYIKPGLTEYMLEAKILESFISQGASGNAFEPIVASGKNACYLHYVKNNSVLQANDLVLLDFGAEYANYASDCSRTIPVSGKFSKRQKEVYSAVLRVMKQTKQLIVPGNTIEQYHKKACVFMEQELIELGLLKQSDVAKQHHLKPLYLKYFMHGVSHFMGLDTHDVGSKTQILEPGMVVTCEPGIYIPEEGIGIRLENDILVTKEGNIDLMEDIEI